GLFLALLVIHGLLHGMFANIIMAASTDLIPKERLGEGLGWLSLAITISMGLGPYLGLWALQDNNYSLLFFLCTGFMVVGVFCTFFLDKGPIDAGQQRSLAAEAETAAKSGPVPGWKRLLQHFFEKSAVPGAILIFLLTICSTSVNSFLSPFAVERGFGEAAQWYFAVYSIMLLITRPATGKLMDKYGDKVVIYPMMALFIVALLVIANMQGPAWIIAAAVLMAFGFGAQFPVLQAIAVRKSMGARVGVATSTFFVLSDFATGMGPAMTGALVPYMGYAGMYLFCVAIVVAAILFYTFVATKQQ
ncbi:MAG: MFS transporter, partial [Eggerthellaceae bacterium]|nr:MFS transporter [Eggerthellaceae bacterium]